MYTFHNEETNINNCIMYIENCTLVIPSFPAYMKNCQQPIDTWSSRIVNQKSSHSVLSNPYATSIPGEWGAAMELRNWCASSGECISLVSPCFVTIFRVAGYWRKVCRPASFNSFRIVLKELRFFAVAGEKSGKKLNIAPSFAFTEPRRLASFRIKFLSL